MRRRIGIAISAMILANLLQSPLAAAEPSLEQLNEISTYLTENDVMALRSYLSLHPELLEGDSQIARLLREFLEASDDPTRYLAFEPDLRDSIDQAASTSGTIEVGLGGNPGPDPDDAPDPVVEVPDPVDEPAPGDGSIY